MLTICESRHILSDKFMPKDNLKSTEAKQYLSQQGRDTVVPVLIREALRKASNYFEDGEVDNLELNKKLSYEKDSIEYIIFVGKPLKDKDTLIFELKKTNLSGDRERKSELMALSFKNDEKIRNPKDITVVRNASVGYSVLTGAHFEDSIVSINKYETVDKIQEFIENL